MMKRKTMLPTPTTEVEWTKKECLADGMSAKEYRIQEALGSLPTRHKYPWEEIAGSQYSIDLFASDDGKKRPTEKKTKDISGR